MPVEEFDPNKTQPIKPIRLNLTPTIAKKIKDGANLITNGQSTPATVEWGKTVVRRAFSDAEEHHDEDKTS